MQTITSERTSRRQVPALFRTEVFRWHAGNTNADIGGGKWTLASEFLLDEYGITNYVIDPFNRGSDHNKAMLAKARGSDTATLCNVLNVIDCIDARRAAINEACCLVDHRKGRVLVYSYEGNRTGVGEQTRDGWQANKRAEDWIEEILTCPAVGSIVQTGKTLIITPRWCD